MSELPSAGVISSRRSRGDTLFSLRFMSADVWRPTGTIVKTQQRASAKLRDVAEAEGSFPVRKRTGTLRIWRAREREPIWGSGGGDPSGVQGQSPWSGGQGGEAEAEGILLPKRANLSLSFK